jgi:hypothetical protein
MLRDDSPIQAGGGMMWKLKRVGVSLIVFGALLAAMPRAEAQSDQQVSVAEAARRAREQKKDAAKPVTVVTNDTLEPAKSGTPEVTTATATNAAGTSQGTDLTVASATGGQQGAADSTVTPAAKEAPVDDAASKAELTALRQEIKEKQSEVDLAQRELTLGSDNFYSRPDFSQDTAGKAKLDAMQSDVAQKQDELTQLKAKLPAGASAVEEKPATDQTQPDQSQQTQQPQQP